MILQDMNAAQARIAALEAQLAETAAKLERAKHRKATLKVSAAGGVSLYGLGKWPVTLYASQWERVLGMKQEILDFISDNQALLSTKD